MHHPLRTPLFAALCPIFAYTVELASRRPSPSAPPAHGSRRLNVAFLAALMCLGPSVAFSAPSTEAATSVIVTIDGKAAAPAMWGMINSRSQLVLYPYDRCSWIARHGAMSVPKDAAGSLVTIDLAGARLSEASVFPAVYTVRPGAAKQDKKAGEPDSHVLGASLADCAEVRREAISGTVTLHKMTPLPQAQASGKIDVKLRSKTGGKISRIVGTFSTLDMSACQAMLPTPDLSAVTDACQASPGAPSGITVR